MAMRQRLFGILTERLSPRVECARKRSIKRSIMMKKQYEIPEVMIIKFSDVIITSEIPPGGGGSGGGGEM